MDNHPAEWPGLLRLTVQRSVNPPVSVWAAVHGSRASHLGVLTGGRSLSSDVTAAPAIKNCLQFIADIVWLRHQTSVRESNDEQPPSHEERISTKITFPICGGSMPLCPVKLHVDLLLAIQAVKIDNSTIEVDPDLRIGWRQVRMTEDAVVSPKFELAVAAAADQRKQPPEVRQPAQFGHARQLGNQSVDRCPPVSDGRDRRCTLLVAA